jgi:hypothetical protein
VSDLTAQERTEEEPNNVQRAVVELAVLRGLLNRSIFDLEPGFVMRSIDEIRGLLRAELVGTQRPGAPTYDEGVFYLTGDQLDALRALLGLVHYDELATSWLALLPIEFRSRPGER